MASRNSASRIYSDVDPRYEWIVGEDSTNMLKVEVTGFKKEELRAQVDTSKNLKISGERNFDGSQWFRFQKSFQLPKTCDISKIRAKFDNGYLFVIVPKAPALNPTPTQDGKTTPNTNTMPGDEKPSNEISGGLSIAGEPERRGIVGKVLKQKLVILNIVIAAVLLVLVLFRRCKFADGDGFGSHKMEQQHSN